MSFKFRLFIWKDPDAMDRGFSLKGIKVPLTTFCPQSLPQSVKSYDGSEAWGQYAEYWKVPVSFLCMAKPELTRHLKGSEYYFVPCDWCDVAPVDSWDELKR